MRSRSRDGLDAKGLLLLCLVENFFKKRICTIAPPEKIQPEFFPGHFSNSVMVTRVASISVGLESKERPRNSILPMQNWGKNKIRKRRWIGEGRKCLQTNPWILKTSILAANGAPDWLDQSHIIDMCHSYDQEWEARLQKFLAK